MGATAAMGRGDRVPSRRRWQRGRWACLYRLHPAGPDRTAQVRPIRVARTSDSNAASLTVVPMNGIAGDTGCKGRLLVGVALHRNVVKQARSGAIASPGHRYCCSPSLPTEPASPPRRRAPWRGPGRSSSGYGSTLHVPESGDRPVADGPAVRGRGALGVTAASTHRPRRMKNSIARRQGPMA